MIFFPVVFLLVLVAVEQALAYSTLRHPQAVSSFSFMHPTPRQQLVSSSFSRMVTPSLRSFTTSLPRLVTTFLRSSSSNPEKFNALEKKIGAIKHLLKGGSSTTASEDIHESVLIYEGGDNEFLRSMLQSLQRKETALQEEENLKRKTMALQRKETALQESKTALIISQTAVGSEGTLRWTRI